jgi:glutamine amidotransferase
MMRSVVAPTDQPRSSIRIVVIDCGMGNLQSIVRALQRVGGNAVASSSIADVTAAEKIVLPGVGSLAQGMENLARHGLLPVLSKKILEGGAPVLGICLGHQMLTAWSEEGHAAGLGWIDGYTRRIHDAPPGTRLKIPHIGWNTLTLRKDCPLFKGIPADACFYFAHSYCVSCNDPAAVVATTHYGSDFVSAVQKGNIFGTQFHPEKSQAHGLAVLQNFVRYGAPSA